MIKKFILTRFFLPVIREAEARGFAEGYESASRAIAVRLGSQWHAETRDALCDSSTREKAIKCFLTGAYIHECTEG